MSSVETVTHYSHGNYIEQEAPHEIEDRKPAAEWPAQGAIEFRDITMRYRPKLPLVLRGLSLSVNGGEKIGVVGRLVVSVRQAWKHDLIAAQDGSGEEFSHAGHLPYRGARVGLDYH